MDISFPSPASPEGDEGRQGPQGQACRLATDRLVNTAFSGTERELDLFNTIRENATYQNTFLPSYFLSRSEIEELGLRQQISIDIEDFGSSHPSNICVSEVVVCGFLLPLSITSLT